MPNLPFKQARKGIIGGKIKKYVVQQHYLGIVLCNLKEIWTPVTPFALQQLGCMNIIEVWGTLIKKFQGDLNSIFTFELSEDGKGLGGMGHHCFHLRN